MKNNNFNFWYGVAALLGLFVIQYFAAMNQQIAMIPYSQFQQLLNEGKVAEVGVSDRFMQGTLKEPLPGGQTRFATTRVDPEIARELEGHGVRFTGQIESTRSATSSPGSSPSCSSSASGCISAGAWRPAAG